jgi:hypothetical protein
LEAEYKPYFFIIVVVLIHMDNNTVA